MEFALQLVAVEVDIVVDHLVRLGQRVFEGDQCLEPFLSQVVKDFVGCNPVYPGVEFCVSAEGGESGPDLDEDVLQKVVGVFVTAQETADVPVEPFRIGMHYAVESLFLPSVGVKFYDIAVSHVL